MLMLKLPTMADMPFRAALMADPDTMAYNAPWFPPDGTIPFPEEKWADWLADWATPSAERFYAFLVNEKGEMVGECSWAEYGESMSVVVKAEYRGRGYGKDLLLALLARISADKKIYLQVSSRNAAAFQLYQKTGFKIIAQQDFWILP